MIFKNVVVCAALDAVGGGFVAENAGHQNEGQLAIAGAYGGESIHAGPAGKAIVGNDGIEGFGGDGLLELDSIFDVSAGVGQTSARKLEQQQSQITRRVLGDEQAENGLGVARRWRADGVLDHAGTRSPSEPTRRPDSTESRSSENTGVPELSQVSPVTEKLTVPGYSKRCRSLASRRSRRCRTMAAPDTVLSTARMANCASPMRARVSLRRKQSVSVAVNS